MPIVNLAIPHTAVVPDPKPYTVYEIAVQTSLRSFSVPKRYSDFVDLHNSLVLQSGAQPPASLPPKHYFIRTTNNESLTESRRARLEVYLRAISNNSDSKWREAPAWRSFLNLPKDLLPISTQNDHQNPRLEDGNKSNSDPSLWLDQHRELQRALQSARSGIVARGTLEDPGSIRVNSTEVKKALAHADALLSTLQKPLNLKQTEWGHERLGRGEIRRRKDLLSKANQEKRDLDRLMITIGEKREIDREIHAKRELVDSTPSQGTDTAFSAPKSLHRGRVLGKETSQTKELDNGEVLQLQKRVMQDQDDDVLSLAATVRRQKELAIQINEELEIQTDMLALIDEDVNRVAGKVEVAKKRTADIA